MNRKILISVVSVLFYSAVCHHFLQLLFQSQNPGVRLEYNVINENVMERRRPEYHWRYNDWTHCTASCGGGMSTGYFSVYHLFSLMKLIYLIYVSTVSDKLSRLTGSSYSNGRLRIVVEILRICLKVSEK